MKIVYGLILLWCVAISIGSAIEGSYVATVIAASIGIVPFNLLIKEMKFPNWAIAYQVIRASIYTFMVLFGMCAITYYTYELNFEAVILFSIVTLLCLVLAVHYWQEFKEKKK